MTYGIFCGLTAAVLMSVSYIFSKRFILRNSSAVYLTLYAQTLQGIFGIILLCCIWDQFRLPLCRHSVLLVLGSGFCHIFGNFCFFRTLKELEASRLSSLLGLKIAMLGMINLLIFGKVIGLWQWAAVGMATVAAVGMNFTGGRITAKAIFWLFLTLLGYSFGDLVGTYLFDAIQADSRFLQSLASVGASSLVSAVMLQPLFLSKKFPKKLSYAADAAPYAVCWFTSLLFLFDCFSNMGVVYGSILQAMRGIFSILLGVLVVRLGFAGYEPSVSRRAWIRRFMMAVLMVCALFLYVSNGRPG